MHACMRSCSHAGGELNIVEAGLPAVATLKPSNTGNTFGMTLGGSLELLGGRVYAFIELGKSAILMSCFVPIYRCGKV